VGLDTPPMFVLSDQNFPSVIPGGGGGTCLKIILIEPGKLAELVSIRLEIMRGFAIPASTVVLLTLASHMATVGTSEYTPEFVRANIKMRETLSGGVRLVHGVPFLLGGTNNIPAIRMMVEINQWVMSTSELNSDITVNRTL
jgi:hypothetical protein